MVAEFPQRDAQSVHDLNCEPPTFDTRLTVVTHNAANGEEPNYHRHDFSQTCGIATYNAVDGDCLEELQSNVQVEDRTHANRPEEPNEQGLVLFFDLSDFPMHCIDDRHTAKKEDQNPDKDKAVDWDYIVVHERGPRAYRAKPHED